MSYMQPPYNSPSGLATEKRLEAFENVMRELALFLGDLPQDLGKGSLNGMKAQLQYKLMELGF